MIPFVTLWASEGSKASAFKRPQTGSLGFQMAGHLGVQPALELGGQMNDFDGHGLSPLQVPRLSASEPRVTPLSVASKKDIACLADRFQYLSVSFL